MFHFSLSHARWNGHFKVSVKGFQQWELESWKGGADLQSKGPTHISPGSNSQHCTKQEGTLEFHLHRLL